MYCWDIKSYLCISRQNLQIYPKTTKNTHLNTQTCTLSRHVFLISVFSEYARARCTGERNLDKIVNLDFLKFSSFVVFTKTSSYTEPRSEVYFNTDRSMTFKRPKGIEKPSRVVFVEIWRIAVHTNSYGAIALEQSLVGLKSRSSIFPCILACRLVSYGFDFDYWITKWQKEEIEEKCFP